MDKIIIQGGRRLAGEVTVSGAKNAALPVLVSSLLTAEACTFKGIPRLADIRTTVRLLAGLGVKVEQQRWLAGGGELTLQANDIEKFEASYDLVKTMRASFLVLGPLLARFGCARVSTPGGCAIGARPINLHLKGLEALGAKIEQAHGYSEARAERLQGAKIYLDLPYVGATENLMMAAALADGTTLIENAAKEPEVSDLAENLEAFMDHSIAHASPVNAVVVLSRADEIGSARPDALISARAIADRYAADPRVRELASGVVPVAGLLAETGATLRQDQFEWVRRLANLPHADRELLLVSVDRFRDDEARLHVHTAARAQSEHGREVPARQLPEVPRGRG